MPFVIDASVAAGWALPDESSSIALKAMNRFPDDTAFAPALWWFEIRNLLVVNERRKRITANQTTAALALFSSLPIEIDRTPHEADVLRLSREHHLTVYDAAYLELAKRMASPLATLDKALIKAAKNERVAVMGP